MKIRRRIEENNQEVRAEDIQQLKERMSKEQIDNAIRRNEEKKETEEPLKIVLTQPHGEIERYYLEAIYKAHKIKTMKAEDYNSGRVLRTDYYLYGEKSILNEIWKKILRLVSLYDTGENPNNESIEDNLLDLMNYCADLYSYIKWKENGN